MILQEISYWQKEAKSCIKRQEAELKRKNTYPGLIYYYEGKERVDTIYPHVSAHEKLAIINDFFPSTNSLISDIMYQNPDIIAEAAKPEAEDTVDLMKAALTYATDKTDMLTENRLALFDMLYAGYCAVEVGHVVEQPEAPKEPGLLQKMFGKTEGEIEEQVESELPLKEEAYATSEMTFLRRWNPLNVFFDYRAERLKDMRYIMKRIEMSKAEFDTKYPKFKDKILVGTDKLEYSEHEDQSESKKVVLYSFQIKKKQNEYWNLVICPNHLREEIDYYKRPYVTNGFDIKIGTLHKYGKIYPISMAQINKKMQDEMNHYVRWMMEVAEKNIPKRGIKRSSMKQDTIAAANSNIVNELVPLDGIPANELHPLPSTNISVENKELIALFEKQKEKGWSVSAQRLGETGKARFATELDIQEAGFQAGRVDIQEGLRMLIKEELETLKDIIINFWDGQYFFKITGGAKPEWYVPQVDPMTGMVLNPLTDVLIGDYDIKVDISTALRPNKERKRKEIIEYLTWLTNPNMIQFLMMQGLTVNAEAIKKTAKEFGLNAETLFVQQQLPQGAPGEQPI